MKPLICFYENGQYIFSTDYRHIPCPAEFSVEIFLEQIEKVFFDELKVVQVNFEAGHEELFCDKISLYKSAKAQVFIFNHFKLKTLSDVVQNDCATALAFQSLVSRNEFIEKTNFIVEEIKKGRIYQVNLTSPLKGFSDLSGEELFAKYKNLFTGDYKALLPSDNYDLLSFSPELFLEQKNGTLITRPIKGSQAVGAHFSEQLEKSKKEEAELSMIVDLLRNDLNSLSSDKDAIVTKHREKMQLGYIQHTFSEIAVKSELPLSEVLTKTLPGGSISGCPKIESLRVINEVEKYKRQAYTGILGWWKKNEFGLNITIRSFIKAGDELFYHAGCGIVYDSDPESEWQEFLLKTGALNVR